MRSKNKSTILVIDIGSSKISSILAKVKGANDIEIIHSSCRQSVGVKRGIISDPDPLREVVSRIIESFSKYMSDKRVSIYVTLSSPQLLSRDERIQSNISGHPVTEKERNKIVLDIRSNYKRENLDIIHTFFYNYSIDGYDGIINPIGMYGNVLVCNTYLVSCQDVVLNNMTAFMNSCGINIDQYISSHYANAYASLTEDEMELGAAVIEIGGGITSFSIFLGKYMIYFDSVPFGGISITTDIAKAFGIKLRTAEKIKSLYTTLIENSISSGKKIEFDGLDTTYNQEISDADLSLVTSARLEEIVNMLIEKCPLQLLRKVNSFIVTGGSSRIAGMVEFISKICECKKVRVGMPIHNCKIEDGLDLEYASAIGVLKYLGALIDKSESTYMPFNEEKSIIKRFMKKLLQID